MSWLKARLDVRVPQAPGESLPGSHLQVYSLVERPNSAEAEAELSLAAAAPVMHAVLTAAVVDRQLPGIAISGELALLQGPRELAKRTGTILDLAMSGLTPGLGASFGQRWDWQNPQVMTAEALATVALFHDLESSRKHCW